MTTQMTDRERLRSEFVGGGIGDLGNVAHLVPGKTDAELAADFKKRMVEAYGPVLGLLDEAHKAGMSITCAAQMGPLGKFVIAVMQVTKVY
jgi:hypothetical protein